MASGGNGHKALWRASLDESLDNPDLDEEEPSERARHYLLLQLWKKGKINFNENQMKLFTAILRGRKLDNQILAEALFLVLNATDIEAEMAWWK